MKKNDMRCVNCDKQTDTDDDVCESCYRDPQTNNCEGCNKHLSGIRYPYTCGDCFRKGKR